MKMKYFLTVAMCLLAAPALADTSLNVVGLFTNKAIVKINGGVPRTISAGQAVDGVKLISASSESAIFSVEGKRQTLKMGQGASVAGTGGAQNNDPVSLYLDSRGQFMGNLSINGVSLKYVVATGSTTVVISSADAQYARIDYEKGQRAKMITAIGVASVYLIKLNTLKFGTIVLHNVDASVVEGGTPVAVQLGMSALNRLEMKRDNSIMTLSKKY